MSAPRDDLGESLSREKERVGVGTARARASSHRDDPELGRAQPAAGRVEREGDGQHAEREGHQRDADAQQLAPAALLDGHARVQRRRELERGDGDRRLLGNARVGEDDVGVVQHARLARHLLQQHDAEPRDERRAHARVPEQRGEPAGTAAAAAARGRRRLGRARLVVGLLDDRAQRRVDAARHGEAQRRARVLDAAAAHEPARGRRQEVHADEVR